VANGENKPALTKEKVMFCVTFCLYGGDTGTDLKKLAAKK
jgi:hypothetical protein